MKVAPTMNLVTPAEDIKGEDEEDTTALKEMLKDAESYLSSFGWCPLIAEKYMGFGVGGVLALFLFRLQKPINDIDEWLWVVEGDLPSAYFVLDQAQDPASALRVYCDMMEAWAGAVLNKDSLEKFFPVRAKANEKTARMLLSRIKFIRERLIPQIASIDKGTGMEKEGRE